MNVNVYDEEFKKINELGTEICYDYPGRKKSLEELALDEELERLLRGGAGSDDADCDAHKVVIPTSITPPKTMGFPKVTPISGSSTESLLTQLSKLMVALRASGDYHSIRDEYCRLSVELNELGLLAPSGRPLLNTGKRWGDRIFKEIHRDQLVIDCHWLHATKQRVNINRKDVEFEALFDHREIFPFELAWAFALKEWRSAHRVVSMLRLTQFQQFQLLTLRDASVRSAIDYLEKPRREKTGAIPAPIDYFEQKLNSWCERDSRVVPYRAGYLAVWKSRQLLGSSASVSQVGKLAAFLMGEPPKDDKTIRTREKKIAGHILT